MKLMIFFPISTSGLEYDQFSKFWKQKGFQGKQGVRLPNFKTWGNSKTTRKKAEDVDFSDYSDFNKFLDGPEGAGK